MNNLLKNISSAVCDLDSFHSLLFDNYSLTQNRPVDSRFMTSLVSTVAQSRDKLIVEVLIDFLKLEDKDYLEKKLLIAIFEGDVEKAEASLNNGAKLIVGHNYEYIDLPAIYSAVLLYKTKSRKEMLNLLIQRGLDIHIKTQTEENLFHVIGDHDLDAVDVAEILFNSGLVEIDKVDLEGYTPLINAVDYSNLKLIKFYIDKGANVNNIESSGDFFPLMLAVTKYDKNILDLLFVKRLEINAQDYDRGITALHLACSICDESIIKLLIQNGADVTMQDDYGETPFSFVSSNEGKKLIIKELAKLKFGNFFVPEIDINLLQRNPTDLQYFEKCLSELNLMKNTKFFFSYSYYDLLKTSDDFKKISQLTKNRDFIWKFQENLKLFSYYLEDLQRNFSTAEQLRDDSILVNLRLNLLFKNILPDVAIRKVAENISPEDLPDEQA